MKIQKKAEQTLSFSTQPKPASSRSASGFDPLRPFFGHLRNKSPRAPRPQRTRAKRGGDLKGMIYGAWILMFISVQPCAR